MLESGTQRIIRVKLENAGFYVIKIMQSNKNGIPDLLCFKKVKSRLICFMVEAKRTEINTADPLQVWRHKEIQLYGMKTFIANNWDDLKEALMQKKFI